MLPVAALHLTYGSTLAPSSFHRVPVLSSGPAAASSSSSSSHASHSCDPDEKAPPELCRAPSDAPELPFVLWCRTLSREAPVPLSAVSLVPRGEPPPAGSTVVNGSLGHVSDLVLCACPLLRAGAGAAGAPGNARDADARVVLDLRVVQGEGAVPGFDRVTPGIAVSSGESSEGGGSGGGGGGGGGEALVYLHVKSGLYDAAAASGGAGGRGIRVG